MNIAIDIDDTITAQPALFSLLTQAASEKNHKVIIVSSRSNTEEVLSTTKEELRQVGICFDKLYLLEDISNCRCPHDELNWYDKYLWQKVDICQKENVDVVFEDDLKVIALFKRYAPTIQVIQVHKVK